ncbi:MAG TPA: 50S ribosomal protein L33 [Candidatus Hydrogenedens sp.]|nr:50S ribosomal protein L33 [Candidatus Hydrogenedens sp.]HOK09122.1 50S ribosomal protein L33 [Candidatus Hydrogenedens sp.]HOL20384.1 50S ribosomal protein L33 [Candidatus Hydrogenedens sp.]HPP58889.1 50S ribosomal protein L33 [Candidatus Hydrogenedens sp.]
MREQVILQCMECKRKNYTTTREKRKHPERLEIKKFCKFDRKHTVHREMK